MTRRGQWSHDRWTGTAVVDRKSLVSGERVEVDLTTTPKPTPIPEISVGEEPQQEIPRKNGLVVYEVSRERLTSTVVLTVGFIIVCIGFGLLVPAYFFDALVVAGICLVYAIDAQRRLHSRPGRLVIDRLGVVDETSPEGIGRVTWEDIAAVEAIHVPGAGEFYVAQAAWPATIEETPQSLSLALDVKNRPGLYARCANGKMLEANATKYGLPILIDTQYLRQTALQIASVVRFYWKNDGARAELTAWTPQGMTMATAASTEARNEN